MYKQWAGKMNLYVWIMCVVIRIIACNNLPLMVINCNSRVMANSAIVEKVDNSVIPAEYKSCDYPNMDMCMIVPSSFITTVMRTSSKLQTNCFYKEHLSIS